MMDGEEYYIRREGSPRATTEEDEYYSSRPPGVKFDDEKPRPGLVLMGMARALWEVGEVATFGARKYTADGWTTVPDGEQRYTNAMLRHLMAEAVGEESDAESGLRHAAHTAWNALARLDLMIRREEEGEEE